MVEIMRYTNDISDIGLIEKHKLEDKYKVDLCPDCRKAILRKIKGILFECPNCWTHWEVRKR